METPTSSSTRVDERMERQELLDLLERMKRDVYTANAEKNALEEAHHESQKEVLALQSKCGELQTSSMITQLESQRLQRERDSFESQNTWLQEELTKRNSEIVELLREKATQTFNLQSKLETTTDELENRASMIELLRQQNRKLEESLDDTQQLLKETKDALAASNEDFVKHQATQDRLNELYQSSENRYKAKIAELEGQIQQLKSKFVEERTSHEEELAQERETYQQIHEQCRELQNRIKELEESRVATSPTFGNRSDASFESRYRQVEESEIGSGDVLRRRILLELEQKYEKASRELNATKNENRQLNHSLAQVLKEVEAKAPIIQKQREEYERAMQVHNGLVKQVETLTKQVEFLKQTERATLSENASLKQEVADLARQVQMLLKETTGEDVMIHSVEDESEISGIIPDTLVTFRSIIELQRNNQELLKTVRQLGSETERKAREHQDKSLQLAMKELQELRETRKRDMERVEGIAKQRDTYKSLLAQYERGENSTSTSTSSSTSTDYPAVLKELKDDYENYRREQYAIEKTLKDKLDQMKEQFSLVKVDLAKSNTQVEYLTERYNLLKTNTESQSRDVEKFRQKNMELSTSIIQHQQNMEKLSKELSISRQENKRFEIELKTVTSERDVLKGANNSLSLQNASILAEKTQQHNMLDSLQSLLQSKERNDAELRSRLNSNLENLEQERAQLRQQLEEERENSKTLSENLQLQVKDLQGRLKSKDKEKQDISEEALRTNVKLETVTKQNSDLKLHLEKVEKQLTLALDKSERSALGVSSTEQQLQTELNNAKLELEGAKEELESVKEHLTVYKSICEAHQETLKEQAELSEKFQTTMEKKYQNSEQEREAALVEVKRLVGEIEALKEIYETEKELVAKSQQKFQDEYFNLKVSSEEMQREISALQQKEAQLLEDLQVHSRIAKEAQSNYERELTMHANALTTCQNLRNQISLQETEIQNLKSDFAVMRDSVQMKDLSFQEQKHVLENQIRELEIRISDLTEQNKRLYNQIDAIGTSTSNVSISGNSAGNSEQELRQVIGHLTKEMEILEVKYELAKQEILRHQQNEEQSSRIQRELTTQLKEEQIRNSEFNRTEEQHKAILEQLNQLNLLRESNVMLRTECENYHRKSVEISAKFHELEQKMAPLVQENAKLVAEISVIQDERRGLQDEIKHWQTRVQKLLDKFQKIDPETHNKLLEEHAHLSKTVKEYQDQVEKLNAQIEEFNKLKLEFSELKNANEKISQEIAAKNQEIENSTKQTEKMKNTALHWKKENEKTTKSLQEKQSQVTELEQRSGLQNSQVENLEKELSEIKKKLEDSEEKKKKLGTLAQGFKNQIAQLQLENANLSSNATAMDATPTETTPAAAPATTPAVPTAPPAVRTARKKTTAPPASPVASKSSAVPAVASPTPAVNPAAPTTQPAASVAQPAATPAPTVTSTPTVSTPAATPSQPAAPAAQPAASDLHLPSIDEVKQAIRNLGGRGFVADISHSFGKETDSAAEKRARFTHVRDMLAGNSQFQVAAETEGKKKDLEIGG
eukprot:TRINITY_DN2008_c0_g1_i1.p1 TRINITY_DN2008_c0_g1~~TRINITY_DN2008_c0_g1_i1.p1  ORF type:complete len:1535 (+),score=720.34 TRINITY_DN2008_c0_g1_i1:41-4645(+)